MKYKQLSNMYKADTLAEALYGREVEYFHYEFDSINFMHLIDNAPDGVDLSDIKRRLKETLHQMEAVQNTYNALEAQITDVTEHEAAIVRTTKKREVFSKARIQ